MIYTSADVASLVNWVSILSGIGGLVTGSISLTISLREKRRRIKVALQWGIDSTYEKTSGIVLWIYAANSGYQPVVIQSAGLHISGIPVPVIAAKPHAQNLFPLKLEPGEQFSTSLSSEVLIETFRLENFQGKRSLRGFVTTVFGEYQSSRVQIDVKRLETLVALVNNNAAYKDHKDFMRSVGNYSVKSFTDIEQWVESIAKGNFVVKDIMKSRGIESEG
jgi:hypothetical protein